MAPEGPPPERCPGRCATGFNGAGARWRRKERVRVVDLELGTCVASTGPALDGAGRVIGSIWTYLTQGGLQRGRRSMAPEGQVAFARDLKRLVLQRGRRSMAPEGPAGATPRLRSDVASTGPALDGAGRSAIW